MFSNVSSNEQPIKQEPDQDKLDPTKTLTDTSGAPAPSSVHPLKKRRVTISGAPALNTDVRVAQDQTNSTPISPVIVGFSVDPAAAEQVRSMLTVKQKQKALIEQRRGSITSTQTNPDPAKALTPARSARRSPNAGTGTRRAANASPMPLMNRPPSPSPVIVTSQQPTQTSVNPQSLPPPPISFARRRATQLGSGGKKKPADIVISPREEHTPEQLAPSIQSAPAVPHAGFPGRFPMTLPRLPSVLGGGDNVRRTVGGNVPPTPTRLATMRNSSHVSHAIPAISGRSPPTASVGISSALVPPTPHSLHRPGYSGEKSAFLAPFEIFYDALNDSKQLKTWLGEQLQRSNALLQSLTQQQDRINELVENLVDKKVAGMRHEMTGLYRRIEELEDALRVTSAGNGRRLSADGVGFKTKGKQPLRNGIPSSQMAQDSYTFPPVDRDRLREVDRAERRLTSPSPSWRQQERDRDPRESLDSENDSTRRLSISASRLDPPRPHRQPSEDSKGSFNSPPVTFRDSPHLAPPVKLLRVGSHKSPRMTDRTVGSSTPSPPQKEESRNLTAALPPEGDR